MALHATSRRRARSAALPGRNDDASSFAYASFANEPFVRRGLRFLRRARSAALDERDVHRGLMERVGQDRGRQQARGAIAFQHNALG